MESNQKTTHRLQVLVATMNQRDQTLPQKMNLHSDAIIINQCDHSAVALQTYNGYPIHWYSFREKGVGLSRNNALMRAQGEIVLFADDDVSYIDGYAEIILREFDRLPQADIIIFNLDSDDTMRPEYINHNTHRIHFFNCLRYGACRIAVRLERLRKENISFHLLFGGGSRYGSGEDSIFLTDCLRHGLKLYASDQLIGHIKQRDSSWFSGYNERYFWDKGALFGCISKHFSGLLCLQYYLRHKKDFGKLPGFHVLKLMHGGKTEFKKSGKTNFK